MKRISIAFVASTMRVGGAERVMSDMITRLPRGRFVPFLYFLRDAGPVGHEMMRSGVGAVQGLERFRGDITAVARLAMHFRSRRPDIVFCLDHHNAMLVGRLAGLLTGIESMVVASHSTGLFGRRGSFRRSDRVLMEFTDRVVALSATHADYLREQEGVDASRIAIIENGVDVAKYAHPRTESADELKRDLGLRGDEAVVTMVAALRPEKAHEALVGAAARLKSAGRHVSFLIVGDGPVRDDIERRIRQCGVEGNMHVLGVRDDVARLLHISDVLVLPSHPVVETLPLCVLEAMAAGVPVVASRVGSVPEVVRPGETGVLIRPADPVELADGIAYILDHPSEARSMAERARNSVNERYSVERMTAGYGDLFEALVS